MHKVKMVNHAIKERVEKDSILSNQLSLLFITNLKSSIGVFASDLIDRCVEKWFAEQEKFDIEGQEYYKNRGNNYTQMMWKASKKCKYKKTGHSSVH